MKSNASVKVYYFLIISLSYLYTWRAVMVCTHCILKVGTPVSFGAGSAPSDRHCSLLAMAGHVYLHSVLIWSHFSYITETVAWQQDLSRYTLLSSSYVACCYCCRYTCCYYCTNRRRTLFWFLCMSWTCNILFRNNKVRNNVKVRSRLSNVQYLLT